MVLYATQPKTLSPADPCNKVPFYSVLIRVVCHVSTEIPERTDGGRT